MNKITFPLKPRMKGSKVANLQDALQHAIKRNAILTSDDDARREFAEALKRERVEQTYSSTTRKLVSLFQEAFNLQPTGNVDEPTADALNRLLTEWGLLESATEDASFIVRGRVVSQELRGLPGIGVVAVDKNIGQDLPLGETMTGDGGRYEIAYKASGIRTGKEKPDTQIKITDQGGKTIAVSPIRYNAGPEENNLDIIITAEQLPRAPEYRKLSDDLGAQLQPRDETDLKKRLAALKENDKQQDITYLANKTGWDARVVAMTALANEFSFRSGVEPEFYYALFRAGVPATESALSQLEPDTVRGLWNGAIERGTLPAELKSKVADNLKRFKQHSAATLLDADQKIGASTLKDIVASALPDAAAQKRIAELYYEHRGDLPKLWERVGAEFPGAVDLLQLDGKLAFLTFNNAPLIQKLRGQNGDLRSPPDLVRLRFYESKAWEPLLTDDVPIPADIPGISPVEKRANYATFIASQIRLSYPTAVIAELVRTDAIPLGAAQAVRTAVAQFLSEHQAEFEFGLQPVERYLRKKNIELDAAQLTELKRLQRVYQISPSDEAMTRLLGHNLDSAYAVVRYDKQTFVNTFKDEFGGQAIARLIYDKAHLVHHTVLNIATAFFLERSAPAIYALQRPRAEGGRTEAGDVLAYPTLEAVFGEMDYCACEHCRSWLNPAAYLVDLLQFLDPPTHERENPLVVLLERRPDIQHLQLTCENTNVALPYIDLVNEILEHYVVNGSLAEFPGHNVDEGITTEELLATPQFVNETAYSELRNELFPSPLPFHQPLEALRRYFKNFRIPLYEAMERLRPNDNLERAAGALDPAYGWRDVLMERLQFSRAEYAILTDAGLALQTLYGEDREVVTVDELIDLFSNAKRFARSLNLTYEELIEITRTRFINPHSQLITKLEKLGVNFVTLQRFIDGALTDEEFDALLPDDLNEAPYVGDVKRWVRDNEAQIMGLIVLSDPTGNDDICSFDTVEFRYSLPDFDNNKLKPIEFLKLLRFIRLWRKLQWSIEETDRVIAALYPPDQYPGVDDDYNDAATKLDAGFEIMIPRIAHLHEVIEYLKLSPKRDLTPLLACWATIDTHGYRSLYRQMFLNPTVLSLDDVDDVDDVFEEDGNGNYLLDPDQKVLTHVEALRAAFNLTQEEFDLIVQELGFDGDTVLNLANVSEIFRHGFLARKLRLSIREFLALKGMSGLNPFLTLDIMQPPDPAQPLGSVRPHAIRLIELAQQVKGSPLRVSQLLYFLQHVDLTGKASPSTDDILLFARTLRTDLLRIDRENVVAEDPTGEVAGTKMSLVYGSETTKVFFGLLNNTSPFSVAYSHRQAELEDDIPSASGRISYDDFQKALSFSGVMTPAEKAALDAAASATDDFRTAVQALFDDAQDMFTAFFTRYPDLKQLYEDFVNSAAPLEEKMSTLLADFLPDLRARLKQQQVRQTVSAQVGADLTLVAALLETPSLLHAAAANDRSAIEDFLGLQTHGISTEIFFADDVDGEADPSYILTPTIDYREDGETLPANPAGGDATISGVWTSFLEAPDNGNYNFYVNADDGAEISLDLDGHPVFNEGEWRNQDPIELRAGRLYALRLTAKKVKDVLTLRWESRGMGREPIRPEQLCPARLVESFTTIYLRVLKALAIAESLSLSSAELQHFAAHSDYLINGEAWLNSLPTAPSPQAPSVRALLRNSVALLKYRTLKETWKIRDERLLEVLKDPAATGEDGAPLLDRVTGWQESDRAALLGRFGLVADDLARLQHFVHLHEAFVVLKKLGIGAATLLDITTNEPTVERIRRLQAALRARYDDTPAGNAIPATTDTIPAKRAEPPSRDWLKLVQPINDELRAVQRDALVASVLHRLSQDDATSHIDTPDKLFEFFLIDVQMDSCMKTSRIRQALSSVQLFTQRCLLNLEQRVASSSIKTKQWEWMKRYRVWEANRKVFLWPENWLDPELRDNKSPFFKDLESELLQSDITDDAAATALVHYLEKLDEVAKLEICGMYYRENEINNEADDIIHVIARTAGARRVYYYRRQEGGTAWTAWERVDLSIEDNPVLPVVWKGRLFLFWLSVLQEVPEASSSGSDTALNLTDVKPSELKGVAGDAKTRVTVTLYWSEYYNGKWQPPRSSDVKRPIALSGKFQLTGDEAFDRSKLTLRSSEQDDSGELFIHIGYPGRHSRSFKLYNTHSLPVRTGEEAIDMSDHEPFTGFVKRRAISSLAGPFSISYGVVAIVNDHPVDGDWVFGFDVLGRSDLYTVTEPRHDVGVVYEAPFFFHDRRHVFFVHSKESRVLVGGFADIAVLQPPQVVFAEPPILVRPDFGIQPEEVFIAPDLIPTGAGDPAAVESFLGRNPYVHNVIGVGGAIRFGDRLIGPGGSISLNNLRR